MSQRGTGGNLIVKDILEITVAKGEFTVSAYNAIQQEAKNDPVGASIVKGSIVKGSKPFFVDNFFFSVLKTTHLSLLE